MGLAQARPNDAYAEDHNSGEDQCWCKVQRSYMHSQARGDITEQECTWEAQHLSALPSLHATVYTHTSPTPLVWEDTPLLHRWCGRAGHSETESDYMYMQQKQAKNAPVAKPTHTGMAYSTFTCGQDEVYNYTCPKINCKRLTSRAPPLHHHMQTPRGKMSQSCYHVAVKEQGALCCHN